MKAMDRNLVYSIAAVLAFVALVGALYVGVVETPKMMVAIKDAATVAALAMGAWSGLLAKRHLTPDQME